MHLDKGNDRAHNFPSNMTSRDCAQVCLCKNKHPHKGCVRITQRGESPKHNSQNKVQVDIREDLGDVAAGRVGIPLQGEMWLKHNRGQRQPHFFLVFLDC